MPTYDAVVLAGGAGSRLGGVDKAELRFAGATSLDRVLTACAGAATTVVVGPRRPTKRSVVWVQERPPGGGPLPALAAGLRQVDHEIVLLLAADLPFLDQATVSALLAALTVDDAPDTSGPGRIHQPGANGDLDLTTQKAPEGGTTPTVKHAKGSGGGTSTGFRNGDADAQSPASAAPAFPPHRVSMIATRMNRAPATTRGEPIRIASRLAQEQPARAQAEGVVLLDDRGREQFLAAAYRRGPLLRELGLLIAEHGALSGLPLRLLIAELALRRLPDPAGAAFDCDTWDDVTRARARLAEVDQSPQDGQDRGA